MQVNGQHPPRTTCTTASATPPPSPNNIQQITHQQYTLPVAVTAHGA